MFKIDWYRRSSDILLELRLDALYRQSDVLRRLREPQHRSDRVGWSTPESQLEWHQQSLQGYVAWKRPRQAGVVVPSLHATVQRDGSAVLVRLQLGAFHRWSDVEAAIRAAWNDVRAVQRQLPGYRRYATPKRGAKSVARDFSWADQLAETDTRSEVGRIRDEIDRRAERKGLDVQSSVSRRLVESVQRRRSRLKAAVRMNRK